MKSISQTEVPILISSGKKTTDSASFEDDFFLRRQASINLSSQDALFVSKCSLMSYLSFVQQQIPESNYKIPISTSRLERIFSGHCDSGRLRTEL